MYGWTANLFGGLLALAGINTDVIDQECWLITLLMKPLTMR